MSLSRYEKQVKLLFIDMTSSFVHQASLARAVTGLHSALHALHVKEPTLKTFQKKVFLGTSKSTADLST